jgi:hypothetical protein
MTERSYRLALPYSDSRGRRHPLIPVTFTYLRTTQSFDGLVDSGAERSACSVRIAEEAGINLAQFPPRPVRGVGGLSRARLCPIDMNILGRRIPVEILVVEHHIVLLGRHDVFRAFQFGFDERAELLLIEPY